MPVPENQYDGDERNEQGLNWNDDIHEWTEMKAGLRIVDGEGHWPAQVPNLMCWI